MNVNPVLLMYSIINRKIVIKYLVTNIIWWHVPRIAETS